MAEKVWKKVEKNNDFFTNRVEEGYEKTWEKLKTLSFFGFASEKKDRKMVKKIQKSLNHVFFEQIMCFFGVFCLFLEFFVQN